MKRGAVVCSWWSGVLVGFRWGGPSRGWGLVFFCSRCRAGRVGYQLKAKKLTMLIREVRLGVAMSNTQKCTE